MAHNSLTISVDKISFTWPTRRTLHAYLVGVSVDDDGQVHVVESPSSTVIKHRPKQPFVWGFGGSGFFIYQKTGKMPALVQYYLLLVRDRETARRAGDVLQRLGNAPEFKDLLNQATTLTSAAGGVAAAAASAVGGIAQPLLRLIGTQLEEAKDKLLDTFTGSQILDAASLAKNTIDVAIPGAFAQVDLDIHLFDSSIDSESAAAINSTMAAMRDRGLLVGTRPPAGDSSQPPAQS